MHDEMFCYLNLLMAQETLWAYLILSEGHPIALKNVSTSNKLHLDTSSWNVPHNSNWLYRAVPAVNNLGRKFTSKGENTCET